MNAFNHNQYPKRRSEKEINLKEYFYVIKKRYWIIILILCTFTFAGYYITSKNNLSIYETSTRIIIDSDSDYMKTLMVMIKDPIIMEKVKGNLKLSRSSGEISNQIEVEQLEDSKVILITVSDQDPSVAVQIANETARTFKKEIVTLLDFKDVQLLSEAGLTDSPVNGSDRNKMIIFIAAGLVVGIGLTFLLESLDGSIKNEEEAEEILGVPILGTISNMNKRKLRRNKEASKHKFKFTAGSDFNETEKKNRRSTIETAESDHIFK